MWLASVSHRDRRGDFVPTEVWMADERQSIADALIDRALTGRGDTARQRSFRMNVTLCRHRVVSEAEKLALPCGFSDNPPDIAGGPVEVLWATPDMPNGPSVQPCAGPTRRQLPGTDDPRLWLPIDCGRCAPCEARARS